MTYVTLPGNDHRPLPFYLAMEEYVARHMDLDDAFFMWQVGPTVIFGRNQLIENEVNMEYCRAHGIDTFRRKSGGGCVYADWGNVMLSYVTKDESVNLTFNRYLNLIVLLLHRMGIEARASRRNDILIGDRKVSGNAFYHLPGKSIVHGTLLFDTDMQHMEGSLTPSQAKLASKGVDSVRQHITLLKEHTDMTLDAFKTFARQTLCSEEICLDDAAIGIIEQIEQEYHSDAFIYGHNPSYTLTHTGRIEGAGDFEVRMQVKNGIIKDVDIKGDYFLVGDIEGDILSKLRGCALQRDALIDALPEEMGSTILHLRRDDLVRLILEKQ